MTPSSICCADLSHMEQAGNTVRVMFFDFSSAFNTIQTALLRRKLKRVDEQLTVWTIDHLNNRPHYVRLHDCVSDVVVCSTGALQGTVLPPFLFSLYTSDFGCNLDHCHISSQIIPPSSNAIIYFISWSETNALRSTLTSWRRWLWKSLPTTSVSIQGKDIKTVDFRWTPRSTWVST